MTDTIDYRSIGLLDFHTIVLTLIITQPKCSYTFLNWCIKLIGSLYKREKVSSKFFDPVLPMNVVIRIYYNYFNSWGLCLPKPSSAAHLTFYETNFT